MCSNLAGTFSLNGVSKKRMSRPNLARLEPSAYAVLSVADPAKVATTTGQVLGDLDLDHLCRLLIRSERSLSLVNRRSFAAALADVPASPNQALRPAPPFAEAVAAAREDGQLLERTRQFLAQNPRALEELTPELTLALLRHFDPSMRMRSTSFTRHVIAVGSVTMIALIAAVLGIVHTQQNAEMAATTGSPHIAQKQPASSSSAHISTIYAPSVAPASHYDNDVAVIPRVVPVPVPVHPVQASVTPLTPHRHTVAYAPVKSYVSHVTTPAVPTAATLFVPAINTPATAASATTPAQTASASATAAQAQTVAPAGTAVNAPVAAVAPTAPEASVNAAASQAPAATTPDSANAAALVLRTIVSKNPNAGVEWIRANKANDHIVTVTTRVHNGNAVSQETYQLWNSNGQFTVINHHATTP